MPTLAELQAEKERRRQKRENDEQLRRFEAERELAGAAEASLAEFFRQAYPSMDSAPLRWNWHIDVMCEHLEAVYYGQIRRLAINVPPRFLKSKLVSVAFPAWIWVKQPGFKIIRGSHDMRLSTRDNVGTRDLITSGWFQRQWGDRFKLSGDQNQKTRFENNRHGHQYATSVGTTAVGDGCDMMIGDDPHAPDDAWSQNAIDRAVAWWDTTMSSRLDDPKTGRRVLVGQRIAENDLTARVMQHGGYVHLEIPHEHDPRRIYPVDFKPAANPVVWVDPRTELGELLHEERIGREEADELKGGNGLGEWGYGTQYQQNPAPMGGGMLKAKWWRFWQYPGMNLPPVRIQIEDGTWIEVAPIDLPEAFDEELQSWDLTFDDTPKADFVCGQHWGRLNALKFLLDQVLEKMNFPRTIQVIRQKSEDWPNAQAKIVEKKANGAAVLSTLTDEIEGMIAFDPGDKSKERRVALVSPQIEAGNVVLPHPMIRPWVNGFMTTAKRFPKVLKDDEIDAMTQALMRMGKYRDPRMRVLGD